MSSRTRDIVMLANLATLFYEYDNHAMVTKLFSKHVHQIKQHQNPVWKYRFTSNLACKRFSTNLATNLATLLLGSGNPDCQLYF